MIESGREDEARELLLAADFQSARGDETWLIAMLLWADACSRLRVLDRAGELYELLAPIRDQFGAGGTDASGSIGSALGRLAATLDRYEEAEAHFACAVEIEERLGAPLFVARTQVGWARARIARGRPEDLYRAQAMLERAGSTAEHLGAEGIGRQVAECRAALQQSAV
jgi:hypothetical protein